MTSTQDDREPGEGAESARLAEFFAAARAEAPTPSAALIGAILSDAATVSAGRTAASGRRPAGRTAPRRRAGIGSLRGHLRTAAALAACAAVGFCFGLRQAPTDVWSLDTASAQSGDDTVGAFFDLAPMEG